MCLVTRNAKPKVAKKPIRVYKVMLKVVSERIRKTEGEYDFYFPYQPGGVNFGETVKAASDKEPYNYKPFAAGKDTYYLIAEQGVHAYKDKISAQFSHLTHDVITEWEIPAGAKYWEGAAESVSEIAATEMKFLGVVESHDAVGPKFGKEQIIYYYNSPKNLCV